jgi:hypothetical protein
MNTLTIAQSTQAAHDIWAQSPRGVNVHSSVAHEILRRIGPGFHIPTDAYADAEALRTEKSLAIWLLRNAVDTSADLIF